MRKSRFAETVLQLIILVIVMRATCCFKKITLIFISKKLNIVRCTNGLYVMKISLCNFGEYLELNPPMIFSIQKLNHSSTAVSVATKTSSCLFAYFASSIRFFASEIVCKYLLRRLPVYRRNAHRIPHHFIDRYPYRSLCL